MAEQYKIIEYPLILLFIVTGALFLMSTNDLVSIFFINRITKLWTLSIVYNIQKFRISHFWWSYVFFIRCLFFLFYIIKYKFCYMLIQVTTNLDSLYIIINISDIDVSMTDKSTNILFLIQNLIIYI